MAKSVWNLRRNKRGNSNWAPLPTAIVAICLYLLLASGVSAAPEAGPNTLAGEVSSATGITSRMRPQMLISPVRTGSVVRAGDRFRTGNTGRIELKLRDGARLSIGPDSDFRIDSYRFRDSSDPDQRSFFSLARGLLRTISGSIGKQAHEDFRLTTPTAVMGIRGTDFTIEEHPCEPAAPCDASAASNAGLTVTVHEGRVAVSNDAGTVEVPKGSQLRVAGRQSLPRFVQPEQSRRRRNRDVSDDKAVDYEYQPMLADELSKGRPSY